MPRYWMLYKTTASSDKINQGCEDYLSEFDARKEIKVKWPLLVLIDIRKGKEFTTREINKKKVALKYAQ